MKSQKLLCCLLLIIGATSITAAKAQVNVNDSLMLVDIYNSTNGPGWYFKDNWLTEKPVSTWYGVLVKGDRVTGVLLYYNELSGTIPASIGNLTKLELLSFETNHLTGTIPSSIGNLVNLQKLSLSDNQLTGSIPLSIGKLVNLDAVELALNQLTGPIPANIGNLTKLASMVFYNNQLSGSIPSSIGKLVNIENISLSNNRLSGSIPSSIGNLTKLYSLIIDHNQLSGSIPPAIGNLLSLHSLFLRYNQLSGGIPASFRNLKDLTNAYLDHNRLSQPDNDFFLVNDDLNRYADVSYNHNTFNGLELLEKNFYCDYSPQAIIPLRRHGNTLSVYAGGTLSNNTYKWHRLGAAGNTTIKGDSTFTPTQNGKYYVKVTNSIVTQPLYSSKNLVLQSDTIDFVMSTLTATNRRAANENEGKIKQTFSASPNPAGNVVHVQLNGTGVITIANSAGNVLLTKTITNNVAINVSAYPNGVYYLKNTTTGEVHKFIVSH